MCGIRHVNWLSKVFSFKHDERGAGDVKISVLEAFILSNKRPCPDGKMPRLSIAVVSVVDLYTNVMAEGWEGEGR